MQPVSPTSPKPKPPEKKDDFTLAQLYTDKVDYLHKSVVDKLHAQLLQVRTYSEVTRVVEPLNDNYRSWMKTPEHPDPEYPLEVTMETIQNTRAPRREHLHRFNIEAYCKQFEEVLTNPMNYIPEMIKYRAFLDIQFGCNKDYEKMLEANPLFCLEEAISRAMSAVLRTDGDSKHAEVARTMTGEVSLLDLAASMHGLQKAQGPPPRSRPYAG